MSVQFTDPYLEARLVEEQKRRGDFYRTKTAKTLIIERLAQLEQRREFSPAPAEATTKTPPDSE